jgi:hypothetical protein
MGPAPRQPPDDVRKDGACDEVGPFVLRGG